MRAHEVAGLLFANAYDERLSDLTERRSMASLPFGGRYRLVDFPLSNLVNAGISNIALITKENYRSLMDHIGSGVYWDLDRKNGGLHLLPPYVSGGARRYHGFVEALYGSIEFIRRCGAQEIVIGFCNTVFNMDLQEALAQHRADEADVTLVYSHGAAPTELSELPLLTLQNRRVMGMTFANSSETTGDFAIGMMIVDRDKLLAMLLESYENGAEEICRDLLAPRLNTLCVEGYYHKGFVAVIDGEKSYFDANTALLQKEVRQDLFPAERPIYTKTRDDMPTRYGVNSAVSCGFVADGCVIDGTVKNSILFRGVKVEKGAVVENSILMQGVTVQTNALVDCVISDKDATLRSNVVLRGTAEHPVILTKRRIV